MRKCFINLKARLVCFSKWCNKSYSVFASLKALVKIGTISATYSLLAIPMVTFAQTDTVTVSKNVDIDEVVISKPSAASTYSELMRAVVVITIDELSSMPITTLQELLEQLASVDIRQRGGQGVQADLMVRGGSFDQVLVLLNGVNITDPQTGHHNLNIPIDLESIERIELLQGPGARIFGPGTYSGVINIITSVKKESNTKLSFTAGQYGLIKTAASATVEAKKAKIFIAASSSKSDGFIENTDFNIYNIFAHSNIDILRGTIDFQVGYQDKAFGAQSFYTPKFPEQFEKTGTFLASTSYNRKINNITITPTVYYRSHSDRFELFRKQAPVWYAGHNYHQTIVAGGKIQIASINKLGRSRGGLEYKVENILSNKLGNELDNPIPIAHNSNILFTKGASRGLANIYLDHTIYLNRLNISAGGLFAYSNNFGVNWNYGIDFSYRLLKHLSIFGSAGNAIRYPTFTDLYYEGPTNYGNINLKPESSDNYEFGIKHKGSKTTLNTSVFHRKGKNVIDWVKNSNDDRFTTMNHTQINTTGIECFAQLNTKGFIPLLTQISSNYHYIFSDKNTGGIISYYALDYLKQKVTLTVSHQIFSKLSASWSAVWQERAGTYSDFSSGLEKPYEPFILINLRTSWESKKFKAFIDVNNIANKSHFDLGNIQQPGRWISIGLTYNAF
jgi:iron complex outermembrane receptor protein